MKLLFDKMHGAGNDFIVADNSKCNWSENPDFIHSICDRHKGIGADGVILIKNDYSLNQLRMTYFNSDGSVAAMCGNGLRCAAAFVYRHKLAGHKRQVQLQGDDGLHDTEIINASGTQVKISLTNSEQFHPVVLENGETVYKGTVGVPHAIAVRRNLETMNLREEGAFLRHHPFFQPQGVNADFVSFRSPDQTEPVLIRTYERGVEDETLACGTGCASAGVVLHHFFGFSQKVCFLCRGNDHIEVEILKVGSNLKGIFLTGPAETAFTGEISVETNFQT
ncbi:MAG: diaminopimelate epimerase [Lentisphaeria bacterium]|nr:diaminopimelate epimerase [Lentisphaeria bacterium]